MAEILVPMEMEMKKKNRRNVLFWRLSAGIVVVDTFSIFRILFTDFLLLLLLTFVKADAQHGSLTISAIMKICLMCILCASTPNQLWLLICLRKILCYHNDRMCSDTVTA